MFVAVEFYFVRDYFSISMLDERKSRIEITEMAKFILQRALVSVLIDGDGELGDERTLGVEY